MVETPSGRIVEGILHDLTKPLIVIREQGQRLSREGLPRKGVLDLASSITKLCEDALAILDRLVEADGFERAGSVASAPLAEVLARVSGALERLHSGRRIPALGRVPTLRLGSPADVVSVLVNLVDNALRATRAAEAVWLEIERDGQWVRISVADEGTGMSPWVVERAFEPRFTTRRWSGGRGLGLASCRHLVERMGGRIDLESRLASGTRATIRLPIVS